MIPTKETFLSSDDIHQRFLSTVTDVSWAFIDKKRKDTTYITHGYHSYPAKFIPQLAERLILQYSRVGDMVLDPFMGCGTTLIESKVNGRRSLGTDINPTAVLISTAKLRSYSPSVLATAYQLLKKRLVGYDETITLQTHTHERIDYWFLPEQKHKLSFLYHEITRLQDIALQEFFFCAFSNILKSCSIWMQKSNKPTRDQHKKPANPFTAFDRQVKRMLTNHLEYETMLRLRGYLAVQSDVVLTDARQCPAEAQSVDLVVTSPPYVTSYEYADLHQLTTLWMKYAQDLTAFRKQFIGSAYHQSTREELCSPIAETIITNLAAHDKKTSLEVRAYFSSMLGVFTELARVLKPSGKCCVVVGNTMLRKTDILNAEVFTEQLQSLGFRLLDIVKREIPSKNLPSTRDEITGRFAKTNHSNLTLAYPTEYIVIMEKL